jgi:hypothetical protein
MSYFKIKCPGRRSHHKRNGTQLIVEQNCDMLLGFIEDNDNTDTTNVYYCRNCKRLVKAHIKKDTQRYVLTLMPKGTELDVVDRSYITNEY